MRGRAWNLTLSLRGSTVGPAKADFAAATNGGNERWSNSAAKAAHLVQCKFQSRGHVLARHIAGGKDELADGMDLQRAFFEQVVADALVGSQQRPAVRADKGEPIFVESSALEVGQVTLERNSKLLQNVENRTG